jgi:hypothetical protein
LTAKDLEDQAYIRRSREALEAKGKFPDPNLLTFGDDAARERAYKTKLWTTTIMRLGALIISALSGVGVAGSVLSAWVGSI